MSNAHQHTPGTPRDPPAPAPSATLDVSLAPLPAGFYARPSLELAPALLGMVLVRDTAEGCCAGLIVETEAYAGERDRASHARAGLTRRTAPMFGPAGHAYVYLVYGLHHCMNVVAGEEGEAGAVLIRALSPVIGVELMRRRRAARSPDSRLCAGPARLCEALAIDRRLDGHDLSAGTAMWLAAPEHASAGDESAATVAASGVVTGPRIGVEYAGPEWAARPWRFGVRGHTALSHPFPNAAVGA